jgi:hypothetical protein
VIDHLSALWLAAFLLEPSERPADRLSRELKAALRVEDSLMTVDPAEAAAVFYGDLDDPVASRAQRVIELPADHSPFLGQPATVAGLIADPVLAGRASPSTH